MPSNAPLVAPTDQEAQESAAPALAKLGIDRGIVAALKHKLSIDAPTSCQALAVPALLQAYNSVSNTAQRQATKDFVVHAQTGSGKTLAFCVPLVQDLLRLSRDLFPPDCVNDPRSIGTLALVLAPTREVAAQTHNVLCELVQAIPPSRDYAIAPRHLAPCLLVGGANRNHEKRRLRKGAPIVVATPGRLLDHLKQTKAFTFAGEPRNWKMSEQMRASAVKEARLALRWLIVDECDRLMDLGFAEQMRGILDEVERRSPTRSDSMAPSSSKAFDKRRAHVLCSATASDGVKKLASIALDNPVVLRDSVDVAESNKNVEQDEVDVEQDEDAQPAVKETTKKAKAMDETKDTFVPPAQLVHSFVTVPSKLRFVALLALLRRSLAAGRSSNPRQRQKNDEGRARKIVVFVSCTDAVEFFWDALGKMGMGRAEEDAVATQEEKAEVDDDDDVAMGVADEDDDDSSDSEDSSSEGSGERSSSETSEEQHKKKPAEAAVKAKKSESQKPAKELVHHTALLPGVPIYRLHGNLDFATRMASLNGFSKSSKKKGAAAQDDEEDDSAIMFCTSVAARGLDIPNVTHVIQLDLPTEVSSTHHTHLF